MRTSLLLALLLFLALIGLNACEPVDDDPVETSASELLGTWVYLPSAPYDTLHQYLVLNDNGVFSRLNRQQYNLHTLLDGYYVISGDNLLLDYEIYRYQLNAQDANLWISSNPGDTLFYVRADEERDPGEWLIDLPIVDRTEINLKTISTAFLEFDGTAMWGYQDGDSGRGMVQFSMSGDSPHFTRESITTPSRLVMVTS